MSFYNHNKIIEYLLVLILVFTFLPTFLKTGHFFTAIRTKTQVEANMYKISLKTVERFHRTIHNNVLVQNFFFNIAILSFYAPLCW